MKIRRRLIESPIMIRLRKIPFLLLSCVILAITGCQYSSSDGKRANAPNILVILTDDQGWGDLSLNGNKNLRTPHMDSIGLEGAIFERFFVSPVCAPTRAEFLTGRYHSRGGVRGVSRGEERLNLDEATIAETFRAVGYSTGLFGKWHNGSQYPYHPNGRGFDEFYGYTSGHWGDYFDAPLEYNGELVRSEGFLADVVTNRAMEFIASKNGDPFFCFLSLPTPHSPFQVPDEFYDRFKNAEIAQRYPGPEDEELDKTRSVLAMVENLDWNIGRVLDQLDSLYLADDTIVVFLSDNGPNTWRWNGDMKGRKSSTDEGGVRSPCMIRWTRKIRAGLRIPEIAGTIDLFPTLAVLAGIPLAMEKPLDGRSLLPLLGEDHSAWSERIIFTHYGGKVSARTQRHRLDADGRLFDMQTDPGQTEDIAAEAPEEAKRLRDAVARWREEVLPKSPDDRPFTVSQRDYPVTYLPARDGNFSGGIRRSDRAPNCSYFTHWTSPEDRMTWDIEVQEPGDYEATIYYTCAEANLGSEIELAFGAAMVTANVTEANDPPAVGAEHDRAARGGESLVKDFKPMTMGLINLSAGRNDLVLRAPKVAKDEVMEVRMIELRRRTN